MYFLQVSCYEKGFQVVDSNDSYRNISTFVSFLWAESHPLNLTALASDAAIFIALKKFQWVAAVQ